MSDCEYDVIIIGAGIGGLAAGIILVKNGMKVLILEKNVATGGAVSTYYRNGYPIDISHALCALNENACLRSMLEYLDVYGELECVKLDKTFIYMSQLQDKPIFCYSDFERYAEEICSRFPEEATNVKQLFKEVQDIWSNEVLRSYHNPPMLLLLFYPFLFPRLVKYRNYSFEQFLDKFIKSSQLKEVLSVGWPYLGVEKERLSALYMICLLGSYQQDGTYFIKGGFGKLIDGLTLKFKELGGELLLNTEVKKILLNDRKSAYAVKDGEGSVYRAKKIVSNADSKRTFLELLDANCLPRKFLDKIHKSVMTRSAVLVHVFAEAEVGKEFLSSGSITLPCHVDLEKRLRMALKSNVQPYEKPVLFLSIHPLEDFITGSPENSFVFNVCWYPANYHLWSEFVKSYGKVEYESIKKEISEVIVGELKRHWTMHEVEASQVLTPISLEKWLGATDGAIYDLAVIPEQSLLNRLRNRTPVTNLYLVGTKTFGSGIPGGLFSAFALGDTILNGKLTRGRVTL
jgi:all-trans-retinol 13,14-reductase